MVRTTQSPPTDVTQLSRGQDFRDPVLRGEVFDRFYQFHLKYRSHPGCVYYLIPYLRDALGWGPEETLWFAFINGNTQHPVTSLILHRRFPHPRHAAELVDFWQANYASLAFDTDRRHHKKSLHLAVLSYLNLIRGYSQEEAWLKAAETGWPMVWAMASSIYTFGRLSAFSYVEYLRIAGIEVDCPNLMLSDRSGSRSHRNGICKVLGLDQLDWHSSNPGFDGFYPDELVDALEDEGARILNRARTLAHGQPYSRDVSYLTLESALCTFKSWFRKNRRYPNVYNDMLYDRLTRSQAAWPDEDLSLFWAARAHYLPPHLRLEDSPHDPGCVPFKQNHFRETGEVVMMHRDWPEFGNAFNDAVESGLTPRFR